MQRTILRALPLLTVVTLTSGCGKKLPPELQAAVDAQRAAAAKAATDTAPHCAELRARIPLPADPSKVKPLPPNPAKGTALESDAKVKDVQIMCNWATGQTKNATMSEGTGLPNLKGTLPVPKLPVTMPEDKRNDTCKDGNDTSCDWVVTPSRYLATPTSADLHLKRPSPEGYVEITVILDTQ